MDDLFAFFFKYRLFFFRSGDFELQSTVSTGAWIAVLIAVPVFFFLIYRRRWLVGTGRAGWIPFGLRTALFLVMAFMLSQPVLVLSSLVPKENLLGILVDNSKSMGIQDEGQGTPRGFPLIDLMDPDSDFMKALDERFYVRSYRFDSRAARPDRLEFDWSGDQTNIGEGLGTIAADTKNLPVAGIVLFSDGADTGSYDFSEVFAELKARKIPVHVVGIGPDDLTKDVEVVQVSAPRKLLPETVAVARVTLRQSGYGGSRSRLEVRQGTSLVEAKEVYFPPDADVHTIEVSLFPRTEGIKEYTFKVDALEGEKIVKNNQRTLLVEVEDRQPRILYVEGHPRWEFKYIRRALSDDKYIRLETLLRTALNKFYRQGIEEETTLATGFPTQREDLFSYDGIIFGSMESSFFTYGQMEMVRDFVSQRGGGFLMLGGSKSFQSGKYRNTPIEEVLPVWLQETTPDDVNVLYAQGDLGVRLSQFGENHPVLQLSTDPKENRKLWSDIPGLTDWNRVGTTKPGTITLANFESSGSGAGNSPLLSFQRFGRGHAIALLTGSTWRWQMRQASDDQSHETFWRQMMRWLVSPSKDPVSVETQRETYSINEKVEIRSEVRDKGYQAINDARVEVTITPPSGDTIKQRLHWDSREDGVYRGAFFPEVDGLYRLEVEAIDTRSPESASFGANRAHFITATGAREYFDPVRKSSFLRKLAEETGGNYYTLDNVNKLPEEIVYRESSSSVIEVLDLWDMPINFILLFLLLTGEWVWRKRQGAI